MHSYLLLVGRIVHDLARGGHLTQFDGSELELLLAFLGRLNFESREVTASDKTLGADAGVSYPTANRGLNSLVSKGYLTRLPGTGGLTCGPVLAGIVHAHEQKQGVSKQTVVPSTEVNQDNNSSVLLSELQHRAAARKMTSDADLRQLVLRYGSETVDRACEVMLAQYPDDSRVLKSFGALVRLACERNWKHTQVEARQAQAVVAEVVAAAAPPETATVAVDPDGNRLPVVERWASGAVLVEVVDPRGRKTTQVIPPAMFPVYRWESA